MYTKEIPEEDVNRQILFVMYISNKSFCKKKAQYERITDICISSFVSKNNRSRKT